ncbi:hypothetical protein Tco_0605593 [Tanacetum coccineum]
MVPRAVLMKSGLVSINTARQNISKIAVSVNTARQVNTARSKTIVNAARPMLYLSKTAHSTVNRPINNNTTFKNSNINQRVNIVRGKNVNTARPKAVVNTGNPQIDLLDKQLEGMPTHTRIYIAPSHTKKIFGNVRRFCAKELELLEHSAGLAWIVGTFLPLLMCCDVIKWSHDLGRGHACPSWIVVDRGFAIHGLCIDDSLVIKARRRADSFVVFGCDDIHDVMPRVSALAGCDTHISYDQNRRTDITKRLLLIFSLFETHTPQEITIDESCKASPFFTSLNTQLSILPKSTNVDHHDTAYYIPKYHRTGGFTGEERKVYNSLVDRLFHEGRFVLPNFLEDEPNLYNIFTAIGFDCLLNINEQICPVFVLQFYKSVRFIRNLNGTLSIAFVIDNVETTLTLENFAQILKILCEGVCVYTSEWPIPSLSRHCDPHPNLYPPLHEDPTLIRDALFHTRTEPKYQKIKGEDVVLDHFQMINTELRDEFKKWNIIISENAISLTGYKDHPNASLSYILYCLTIGKRFNLAYYIAHRMISVTQSSEMTLPYAMVLTRLFKYVWSKQPYPLSNDFQLMNHVMISLSNKRVFRLKSKGKRPRLPTPTPSTSTSSDSLPPNQGVENDPVGNYTFDPIEGGESPEFK